MNPLEVLSFQSKGIGSNVVFSHGTPTYSVEYENTVKLLETNFKSILIDHLGFGNSPKPEFGDYSLAAHQRRFRESLLKNGIKSFHLVVHDFGGAIALPLLFDSQFDIRSLTIVNSWCWPLCETEPQLKIQKFLVTVGLLPFLYRYFNFSPKFLLKLAWGKHSPLSKERHEHYISKFPTKSDRSGPVGFLNALFDFDNPCWSLSKKMNQVAVPVQIVWGMADKLVSSRNLTRWIEIFPNAKRVELDNVGHFVADESPEIFAETLSTFFNTIK